MKAFFMTNQFIKDKSSERKLKKIGWNFCQKDYESLHIKRIGNWEYWG